MLWAAPVGFALLLFAKPAIDLLLGEAWRPALILMQAEAAGIILNSIGQSWNLFFAARGQTKPWLVSSVLGLGWTFVFVIPLVILFGINGAAMSIIALALGSYALREYYARKLFGPMVLVALVWRELLVGAAAAGVIVLCRLAGWQVTNFGGLVAQCLAFVAASAVAAMALSGAMLREVYAAVRSRPPAPTPTASGDERNGAWRRMTTPRAMAFPLLAAVDHDGTALWVSTRDWPALGRMDLDSGEWRWTELPSFPHAPSPDPGGGCWTALTRSSALAHVSAEGRVHLVPTPRSRELLVTAIAGGRVWAVDAHRRMLLRLGVESENVAELALPDGFVRPDFITVGPRGDLWVADTQSSRLARVPDPAAPIPTIEMVEAPHPTRALLADPDRDGIWLGASTRPEVSLVDASGNLQQVIALPAIPFGLCLLADGRLATALKEADALCVVDPATGGTSAIGLPQGSMPMGCAAARDRLFVTLGAASEIIEIPVTVPIRP
jgi:streptogramin lyase